ncbi:hypothetical protein CHUAL_008714 [Chamberlinius hualienensis]
MNDSGFLSDPEGEENAELEWQRELNYIQEDDIEREMEIISTFERLYGYSGLTQEQLNDEQFMREEAKRRIVEQRLVFLEDINMED